MTHVTQMHTITMIIQISQLAGGRPIGLTLTTTDEDCSQEQIPLIFKIGLQLRIPDCTVELP